MLTVYNSIPCTLAQIWSAVLKIHLDRSTESCGKGLVWSRAEPLLLPSMPFAGYSERQWAPRGCVGMVTGQAEVQIK